MKYIRHWFGAVLVLPLSFLAGCATPPTTEEISALDYGTCPKNYEATIKNHFQDALLSKYSDELNIWPPQKHWYKTSPLGGSKLQAGYLVPVMADQTFGPQLTAGKQLYGFIFSNGQLVETLNPALMQSHSIKEAVGPIPKDERNWQLGHSNTQTDPIIMEYVLPGESVQNWSELVSMQMVTNVSPKISASKFVAEIADQDKAKPRCATVSRKTLSSSPTEVLYEQTLANCAPFRDEYSVRKAIRGPRSLTEVSYSRTTPMSDAEKQKWIGIVGKASLVNDCQ